MLQVALQVALSAALSATVGLGNIAGVAFAVGIGGPGAVFWMLVGGFLGIGESRVRLMPNQFRLVDDRVIVNMTAEQAKSLPKIVKQ